MDRLNKVWEVDVLKRQANKEEARALLLRIAAQVSIMGKYDNYSSIYPCHYPLFSFSIAQV